MLSRSFAESCYEVFQAHHAELHVLLTYPSVISNGCQSITMSRNGLLEECHRAGALFHASTWDNPILDGEIGKLV